VSCHFVEVTVDVMVDPIPKKNPKSYHPPLLYIAYMATSLLNSEIIQANGKIKPCHNPYQKPTGSIEIALVKVT